MFFFLLRFLISLGFLIATRMSRVSKVTPFLFIGSIFPVEALPSFTRVFPTSTGDHTISRRRPQHDCSFTAAWLPAGYRSRALSAGAALIWSTLFLCVFKQEFVSELPAAFPLHLGSNVNRIQPTKTDLNATLGLGWRASFQRPCSTLSPGPASEPVQGQIDPFLSSSPD